MPWIALPTGRRFESRQGESLLDAGLRAGIALDHSCRTGRCSSCKAPLPNGPTALLHPELGLSDAERAQGWILTCARSAEADLVLDVEDLGDVRLPTPRTQPCRIDAIERLASDVLKLRLRLPPAAAFHWLPGQYIDLIGPDGLRRSYSIANAAGGGRDPRIELHVRAVPGGAMTRHLFDVARMNDLLRLHGPLGSFFLRGVAGRDLVFLATGTGIAPVRAMLQELGDRNPSERPRRVAVYWGGRSTPDLYLPAGEFDAASHFVPVLSRAGSEWNGARGHVQDVFLAAAPDLPNTMVYACGSDAMIRSARHSLVAAGLPERHFRSDAFVASGPA